MGVTGLWKLIEPCGTPVPIETLEGKILAVDISIWLHQVVKGFQDSSGSALAHAHLLGLFHRLCKLMYYRVKPVFVFDGCVPQLKRDTIARRQQQRNKLNNEADRIQNLLLEQLAKEQVVQKALGNAANELANTKRIIAKPNTKDDDEMFKLPELPTTSQNSSFMDESSVLETSLETSDDEENSARRYYTNNLQAIDVHSQDFTNLPADMRYDILVDIKETRKQSSWGRLHELPAQSDDFSSFQMERLLKRRDVQVRLEEAEKEMGGRTLTYSELQTYFKEEGVLNESAFEEASRQIACDENTRYLLVKDLKKQLTEITEKDAEMKAESSEEVKIIKEHIKDETRTVIKEDVENINIVHDEYEADLQLAIALSLSHQEKAKLYKDEDYVLKESEKLKLNKVQRSNLQNAAKGPAKTYMIEYAGMNHEEVEDIFEKTQITSENDEAVKQNDKIVTERLPLSSESETDEDFVEVSAQTEIENILEKIPPAKDGLEVVINLNESVAIENDLFADVFTEETKNDTDSDMDLLEVGEELENTDATEFSLINNAISTIENIQKLQNNAEKALVKTGLWRNKNESVKLAEGVAKQIKQGTMANILEELKKKLEQVQKTNVNMNELKTLDEKTEVVENVHNEKVEENKSTHNIFQEMRKQMEDVNKIDLNAVEAKNDIIDTDAIQESIIKTEVIEIKTPPSTTPKKSNSKSVTPSRITDFYSTEYVVKKTPEHIKKEESENIAQVKSPFYRRKTPKSKSPKVVHTDVSRQTPSKAIRELFPKAKEVSVDDIIMDAASELKQKKTQQELRALAIDLARERRDMESERNRQDRMGMSISQRMNNECQELLRLFGVPFIVAPMEAEAQCAFLDAVQLTHGTITDDSDIWLFGGRTVYKNFFIQNKHVLKFSAEEIETQFKCDRHTLVQLACLVGSDYTTGVHGIGAVTAMEILSSFTRNEQKNASNMSQRIKLIMDTLQRFRDWWQSSKLSAAVPGSSARQTLLKKLRNIELHEGFPSMAVIEAYLLPKVDESRTAFSWGQPDVESIREFARKTFGWTTTKTDEILKPVLKRLAEKRTQTTIRNYFLTSNAVKSRELKVSKRVQGAIQRFALGGETAKEDLLMADTLAMEAIPAIKPKKQNLKRLKNKRPTKLNKKKTEESPEAQSPVIEVEPETMPINLEAAKKGSRKNRRKASATAKEVIPQREKDLERMRQNKVLAAQLFKASEITSKKKKK